MPISRKGGIGTFSKDTQWRENKIYSKDYNYSGEKDFECWGLGFFFETMPCALFAPADRNSIKQISHLTSIICFNLCVF